MFTLSYTPLFDSFGRLCQVSLRDATTMTKMTCPGRTRRCKHLQCFDLRSHVQEAYRKRTKWAATGARAFTCTHHNEHAMHCSPH